MWVCATVPPGERVLAVPMFHFGPVEDGRAELEQLRSMAPATADDVGERPFLEAVQLIDETAPAGLLNYWRGGYLRELSDGAVEVLETTAVAADATQVQVWRMGGAVDAVPDEGAAVPRRDHNYFLGMPSLWGDPSETDRRVRETDELADALRPWGSGKCTNHNHQLTQDQLREVFGDEKFARLQDVKRALDPDNVFRFNQNIEP
jgi:Berberine and berberine like